MPNFRQIPTEDSVIPINGEKPSHCNAALVLADGSVFFGHGYGKQGQSFGEICFNTGMTGYQETVSDLSYARQIIVFTAPHIGNVGTNAEDNESKTPACCGLVTREMPSAPSNFRSQLDFTLWLEENDITGISGIDTRALTRHIRHKGAQNAVIWFAKEADAPFPLEALRKELARQPSLSGTDLASNMHEGNTEEWTQSRWQLGKGFGEKTNKNGVHVVAIDYGQKLNIARSLTEHGCRVTIVPATMSAEDILALEPAGIFLSNGPADPSATAEVVLETLKTLLKQNLPIFGICLGHQLLALALGAQTEKMHQGHRGANHPVKNERSGKVEITSQNHGFVVTASSLPDDVEITHRSLFDGTIEGLRHKTKPVFSVQYHPESSPGPHDSRYLFDEFMGMMRVQGSEFKVQSSEGTR